MIEKLSGRTIVIFLIAVGCGIGAFEFSDRADAKRMARVNTYVTKYLHKLSPNEQQQLSSEEQRQREAEYQALKQPTKTSEDIGAMICAISGIVLGCVSIGSFVYDVTVQERRPKVQPKKKSKQKPKRNITIKKTRRGIEISCPHYRGIYRGIPVVNEHTGVEIGELSKGKAILSWFFLSVILPVVVVWLSEASEPPSTRLILSYAGILVLFWGGILYQLLRTDKIVLSQRRMGTQAMLGMIILRKTDYEIDKITNLRLGGKQDTLQFDYRRQTITWGDKLEREVATSLLHQLSTILTFHCHSVERIMFGEIPSPNPDPYTTLQNIEVSTLSFPFVHLKQILIQTTTYNFHQVERFLTYAVNVIGHDALKKHVDVHLYGDPEKLHPNLRNNFTNLCRSVHMHETNDVLPPMSPERSRGQKDLRVYK